MGLMDSIRSKLELYRLEQRYTRREKRTTFASGAQYIDGEDVYPTTTTTTTSSSSAVGTPETETPPSFSPTSVSSSSFSPNVNSSNEASSSPVAKTERPARVGRTESFAWSPNARKNGYANMRLD